MLNQYCVFSAKSGNIPTEYQLEQFAKSLMLPFTFNDLKNKKYKNWANFLHELGHWAVCHPCKTNRLIKEKQKFYNIPYGYPNLDDVCVEVWCHLVLQAKGWLNPIYDENHKDKARWYITLSPLESILYVVSNGVYLSSPSKLKEYNKAIDTLLFWDINPLVGKYRPINDELNPKERRYKNGRVHWVYE